MESVLWALDLAAVVMLCRWALAHDRNGRYKGNGKDKGKLG